MKLQPAVKNETIHITYGVIALDIIMLIIFTVLGKFGLPVFLGAVLGSIVAITNFLLLGITVQKAAQSDTAKGTSMVRLSYSARMLLMGIFIVIVLGTSYLHSVAAILPLFFPRITIAVMNIKGYMRKRGESDGA